MSHYLQWEELSQGGSRRVPAWLCSTAFHAVLLVLCGLLARPLARGVPGEPGRPAGIVVVAESGEGVDYFTADSAASSSSSAAASVDSAQSLDVPLPGAATAADGAAAVALPQLPDQSGEGLPGLGDLDDLLRPSQGMTSGARAAQAGSSKAETGVFGISGSGNRFVYVFDRSDSMKGYGGRPLAAAKRELINSLGKLGDVHQFQIIFYNHRPRIMNVDGSAKARMQFGDRRSKLLASRFVEGVTAVGGTQHFEPLVLALQMSPEVVFFLTDGTERPLSDEQLRQIRRRNQRLGASIHVIEFGAGPSSGTRFLTRLAAENNGRHVYVDVTRLK